MAVTLDFTPRLMPAPQAAHYLGVSPSMLRTLGIPRVILGSKRLYDRYALDAFANGLEQEGNAEMEDWEKLFEGRDSW